MTNEKLLNAGQVAKLNGLANIAEGAVVSRTLVKNYCGTLTFFAFDKGQQLSEHSAPFDAIVQVTEGVGEFVIDGQSHTVKAGEVIHMPANIPHAVKAIEPFKMLLTMFKA